MKNIYTCPSCSEQYKSEQWETDSFGGWYCAACNKSHDCDLWNVFDDAKPDPRKTIDERDVDENHTKCPYCGTEGVCSIESLGKCPECGCVSSTEKWHDTWDLEHPEVIHNLEVGEKPQEMELFNKFWMIQRLGADGEPSTKVHLDKTVAIIEAERLCEKHPGVDFVLLESVGIYICDVLKPRFKGPA